MPQGNEKSAREWQEIVQEAFREHDPAKRETLRQELEIALDERSKRMRERIPSAEKKSA